ncbi:hypothetical protein K443DRAFT_673551 [Laccaria amethystina LaAM-08-1]|uniref:Uncharacterized protein n=1 Tax=Laccaria amethystina LaAM-08-1 TaxID=1095629 RepID=A0A0C9X523_9AGAR|nr:hypothetical protein K443DRAFT_673551 [Laccaria amethystina LaAM-08-1]
MALSALQMLDLYPYLAYLSFPFRMPRTPFAQISNVTATAPTSAFVIVLARALSSAGFALSLLAIWVGWLLPLQAKPIPPQRRTPHLPKLPKHPHNRRASAPITLTPIFEPRDEGDHVIPKRGYFADRQSVAEQRRNTLPEESSTSDVVEKPPPDATLNPPTVVAPSSILTPPATPPVAKLSFDVIDGSVVDSDSSRHSSMASLCPSRRLPKLKLGFTSRAKQHVGNKHVETASPVNLEHEGSVKSAKRSSGGFSAPWSASRTRTPTEIAIDSEPQTSSTSRLSLVRCFTPTRSNTCPPSTATLTCRSRSRKAQRRTSTPIPRTSPYAAPYFASPPIILDDGYSGYSRGLPQLEDKVSLTPGQSPVMGEFGEKQGNGWDQNHTTTSIYGRFPRTQRVISKRRSTSESWATRSPVPPSF